MLCNHKTYDGTILDCEVMITQTRISRLWMIQFDRLDCEPGTVFRYTGSTFDMYFLCWMADDGSLYGLQIKS